VDEFRDRADEPDHGDRPGRPGRRDLAADGEAGAIQTRVEPRSRAEYAADLKQRAVSGWEQRPFTPRMDAAAATPDRGPADAAADRPDNPGRPDDPLAAVRWFEPTGAGLPDISAKDAVTYIEARHGERPWLAAARGCPPEVQRVFAALDQGGGHAHIRHEGWVTEEMNERRVAYLEDPAQLDPAKRAAGIDGLRSPEKLHRCRETASRITDPDAFAVAFARGIEHPLVRASLAAEFTVQYVPRPVSLYVRDLLGADGHRYCTGWRLQSAEGGMKAARDNRAAWVDARAHGSETAVPEPKAGPAGTFAGGMIVFAFGPTRERDRYEVVTMYPRPLKNEQPGDSS